MSDNRYNPFSQSRQIIAPFGQSLPIPNITETESNRIDRQVIIGEQTDARKSEFAAYDTSFVRYGELNPIVFAAAGQPANILTFQVPNGRTLKITKVNYWLSEPYCTINDQFGWCLSVDSGQVPYHGRDIAANAGYLTIPLYGLNGDPDISPVYVQANSTVSVQIVELLLFGVPAVPFSGYLAGAAYVYGELKKPIGGKAV